MKIVKTLLIVLGFGILFYTIREAGTEAILHQINEAKWQLLPILVVYAVTYFFYAIGWSFSFPNKELPPIPLRELWAIRVIGETLNVVIPFSASFGGEPIKAELLRRRHGISLADGLASILIAYTTFWISLNLFVVGAVIATLHAFPLSPVLWKCVVGFIVGLGGLAALLIFGLYFGLLGKLYTAGQKWGWWGKNVPQKADRFLKLDADIRHFYSQNPKRFFYSVFFGFLGWMMGLIEVWLIARLIGMPIGWSQAWLFEMLIQVLRIVTFFIPASVGAQEGGIVLIFSQFGYSQPMGLAFALVRRLREIIWIALGLLIWSFMREKKIRTAPGAPKT